MPSSADRKRLEVPTHLHERLVEIAIDEDRTVASVVQEIITLGLGQYQSRLAPEAGVGQAPFTERAIRALAFAREEAVPFNHSYLGTEHLLLGLLREGEGVAARILAR
ncbi:MAG TPA: Clp protease N-terminal domain-containing protein, partial [Nitrolancea sp.]|nr:Clp protease N-terminal domain-containing protein [Nitrolancea sp.]